MMAQFKFSPTLAERVQGTAYGLELLGICKVASTCAFELVHLSRRSKRKQVGKLEVKWGWCRHHGSSGRDIIRSSVAFSEKLDRKRSIHIMVHTYRIVGTHLARDETKRKCKKVRESEDIKVEKKYKKNHNHFSQRSSLKGKKGSARIYQLILSICLLPFF